jgi:hypothetical protein
MNSQILVFLTKDFDTGKIMLLRFAGYLHCSRGQQTPDRPLLRPATEQPATEPHLPIVAIENRVLLLQHNVSPVFYRTVR